MDAYFDVGQEDEAALPIFHRFRGEDLPDAAREGESPRHPHAHEQQPVMRARSELAQVREIQVLGDEKPLRVLCGLPNSRVRFTGQILQPHVVHVMTERDEFADQDFRQIFVELQLHMEGAAGTGKSSSAEAAA